MFNELPPEMSSIEKGGSIPPTYSNVVPQGEPSFRSFFNHFTPFALGLTYNIESFKYHEFNIFNVIPSDCVHGCILNYFLLEGVTPKTPISLYSTEDIGVYEDIIMSRTKYVKQEYIERPLTVRRNKLWSMKCPFSNFFRGKSYNGFIEFYINEPHIIDLEQSWYKPTVTVNIFSGIDAKFDFTWEQLEQSPFYEMIPDLEMCLCTYNYVCTDIIEISTNVIKDEAIE